MATSIENSNVPSTVTNAPVADENTPVANNVAPNTGNNKDADPILNQSGLTQEVDGTQTAKDVGPAAATQDVEKSTQINDAGDVQIPPPSPPEIAMTPELATGADSFANGIDTVTHDILSAPGATSADEAGVIAPESMRSFADLSAEMLLAIFMKLQINDPNNSVETHNMLSEISSSLRKLGIENAKKDEQIAAEKAKKASKYASQVSVISNVITVVSVALAVFTLGTSLAAASAVQLAAQGGKEAAKNIFIETLKKMAKSSVTNYIIAAMQLINGSMQATAAMKTADALDAQNNAKRSRLQAEQAQDQIEAEAEIMKMIMESKNSVVEAILKMMKNSSATQTKVTAAGMAS